MPTVELEILNSHFKSLGVAPGDLLVAKKTTGMFVENKNITQIRFVKKDEIYMYIGEFYDYIVNGEFSWNDAKFAVLSKTERMGIYVSSFCAKRDDFSIQKENSYVCLV